MRNVVSVIVLLLVIAGSSGCVPSSESGSDQTAIMTAADVADGVVDSVVSRCAVCALSMDGDEKHSSNHAGYTFLHCSAHCKETFDYNPVTVLARLE